MNIILHGLGQSVESWDVIKDRISHVGNTVVPDLFEMALPPLTYSKIYEAFEEYCKKCDSALNLIGLSLGGVLALDYTCHNPDRVHSLTLIGTPYRVPEELIEKQNEMFTQMPDEAFNSLGISKEDFISIVNTTMRVDIPGMVDKIHCKGLIICGENDLANRESADVLHSNIADSSLSIISGAGHEVNKEQPDELSRILADFVNLK